MLQDTLSEVSQKYEMNDKQLDVQNRIIDVYYEEIFKKYDEKSDNRIHIGDFFNFVNEIINIHNALDAGGIKNLLLAQQKKSEMEAL